MFVLHQRYIKYWTFTYTHTFGFFLTGLFIRSYFRLGRYVAGGFHRLDVLPVT